MYSINPLKSIHQEVGDEKREGERESKFKTGAFHLENSVPLSVLVSIFE